MGVISNGTTLLDAGALDSGIATGEMTLITSTTLSSAAANITFASGISSTYNTYIFKFMDIHPATDDSKLLVNFRDGSTAYDATKTTNFFRTQNRENASNGNIPYRTDDDLAQGTGFQRITSSNSHSNDDNAAAILHLFDPSNTTFVKHFTITGNTVASAYTVGTYIGGYFNNTNAIDAIQFKMSSGNIDAGSISLYGVN